MKKNLHIFSHIQAIIIGNLLSLVISFYVTLLIGTYETIVCGIISTQILLGFLVYHYINRGYNLSVRERSTFREFLIGMLPAQLVHFIFYLCFYQAFLFLYDHRIFESLPIHRLAANTPAFGFAFVLTDIDVLSLTESKNGIPYTALPDRLFTALLLTFLILAFLCTTIPYLCYRRGLYLNDREREEMRKGIIRIKKGSFAYRFRFIPILNIFPLFTFLYHHFLDIEYTIRSALLPLLIMILSKLTLDFLASLLIGIANSILLYYILNFAVLYLWGILISSIQLREEKTRS